MILTLALTAGYNSYRAYRDNDEFLSVVDQVNKSRQFECLVDSKGMIQAWSRGMEEKTGWNRSFALGTGNRFLMGSQDGAEKHVQAFNRAVDMYDGAPYTTEISCDNVRHADDTIHGYKISNHVFDVGGKVFMRAQLIPLETLVDLSEERH